MLVCHCRAVYDRQIREEIANGARDAFDIADACEAGTVCGGCVPAICKLLGQPSLTDAMPLPLRVSVS